MNTIWQLKSYDIDIAETISQDLNISPIVSGLLVQRGIFGPDQARHFLDPDLKTLTDPFVLQGIQAAVIRIQRAVNNQEKIVVYGDYDVDGTCSIVLLKECFTRIGYEVDYYVPDRFNEGYGLNKDAIGQLAGQGCQLLITVDCGISSVEEIELARQLDMDVIITDHHTPPAIQPAAAAIINPKNDQLPAVINLAGVGVSYKLATALMQIYGLEMGKEWLDLVALATIADIVPLLEENRILVKYGLDALQETRRPGLQALMQKTSLAGKSLQAWHVGFVLGPHINSAGRLDSARKSIALLLSANEAEAELLADELCRLNIERRSIEADIYQQAVQTIDNCVDLDQEQFLVVDGEEWHEGVIGIVASRLANNYNRPAMVISWNGEQGKGSARSAGGFDIYKAFTHCREMLEQFGGHKLAGGLTLQKQQLVPFKQALREYMASVDILDPNFRIHQADMELLEEEIDFKLLADIHKLAPFGEGNPLPCFVLRSSPLHDPALVGSKAEHFKSKTGSRFLDVIAFNRPDLLGPSIDKCHQDLLFELSENTFRGQTNLQLKVKDMKRSYYPDVLRGKSNNSARLAQALHKTMQELEEKRPVLFVYPGCRSLKKHLPLLQGLFKKGQLMELHGQVAQPERDYVQQQFLRGEPRIYLSTQGFISYYRTAELQSVYAAGGIFPKDLCLAVDFWPVENADGDVLKGLPLERCIIPMPRQMSFLFTEKSAFQQAGQGVVYANLPSTVQGLINSITNAEIEAGINELGRRKAARRRFCKAPSGTLVIDGTHPDEFLQLGSIHNIMLADSPFGQYELAAVTDYLDDEEIAVACSFTTADLKKNQSYLDRIYPEGEPVQKIWQRLQKYGMATMRATEEQLAARLAADLGRDFRALDLLAALHILADLGLCQFEKSGSIIAIKFISDKNSDFNMARSPYYWEGRAEKAIWESWAQCMLAANKL